MRAPRPVKILELGKFYHPYRGGIETLLRSWCEGFVRLGAEVDCVVASDSGRGSREEIAGVRVHRLPSHGTLLSTSVCPSYLGATRRFPADIWQAHFPNPLADLACLLGPKRTPLVLTYHSDVVRQRLVMGAYQLVQRRLLQRATRIVVATPQHLDFSPWLGPFRAKCEVIPFGIDLAKLAATPDRLARAAELRKTSQGRPIVLNIGRLVGYKGQEFLLEAARGLDAEIWLVGRGPLETELKTRAAGLGIASRVRFWGEADEEQLAAMLHACDVFALPSITRAEAFGIVQVEAMACGKPVVSCALDTGVPFVNQHQVTGLIVAPANVPELAGALSQLLRDASLRARLGAAGQRRAHTEFEESVMVKRYWKLFERLLVPAAA